MMAQIPPMNRPRAQPLAVKRWRVELADKTERTIEVRGFRVEGGTLVLVQPLGCAAAYAPGCWCTIESEGA
jgi:hypothetical protein